MKKTLLSILTIMLGVGVNAQFDEGNSPAINDELTLFLLDSNATDYASEIGNNAVWDYSATTGYNGETRKLTIRDAADTSANGTFSLSTEAFDIEDFFINYMTKDASGKKSQGFIFNAESIDAGIVIAKFNTATPEQLYTYPFNVGSIATSTFEGVVTLDMGGSLADLGLTGNSTTTVDGVGTLKLAQNNYSNVLRYKLVDTMGIILDSAGLINPDPEVQIVRVQYEYYDHNISKLPIFTYTDIVFKFVGETDNLGHLTIVLGYDNPTLSISTNKLEQTKVYPNPTDSKLTIQLPSEIADANVIITDAQGREVSSAAINSIVKTIDVSSLNQGVYFVNIANKDYSATKTVVIK